MDFSHLSRLNPWWKNSSEIYNDEKITSFGSAKIRWEPRLKHYLVFDRDKIYTLRGPRQVGKTTLCKILIKELIEQGTDPKSIFYYSCDLVPNGEELSELITLYLDWVAAFDTGRKYIFLDEISNVKNWENGLKHLVDIGSMRNTSTLLTGSHSIDIKKSIERLPGRRGEGEETLDKILLPMKFAEFAETVNPALKALFEKEQLRSNHKRQEIIQGLFEGKIDPFVRALQVYQEDLNTLFTQYLITGGIPKPINEFFTTGKINNSTYEIYIRSLMGDLARWQIPEIAIKQLLSSIILKLTTNVSWNSLAMEADLGSHNTASKYVQSLENSFVLNTLYAINPSKGTLNITKDKKVYFKDPFIFHSLRSWVSGSGNYFESSVDYINDPTDKSKLVECIVHSHLVRLMYNTFPSDVFSPEDHIFYMKTKSGTEIDYILKSKNSELLAIELKYQNQLQSSDYKSLSSMKKGIMLSKDTFEAEGNYMTVPVTLFLLLI